MDKRAAKLRVKAESAAVRRILLSWDPVGAGGVPDDEYDCLVDHIVSASRHGKADAKDIAAVISSELTRHFGVTASGESVLKAAGEVAAQLRSFRT